MSFPRKLSVIDVGPIRSNQNASDALASMISLALTAEKAGYHRYWLAEHHNTSAIVASNTPLLTGVLGAHTKKIRIGGYVLLPHHTPYDIAEQFATLEALYPERIDACVGCTAGTDWLSASLLRGGRESYVNPGESYETAVKNLISLLDPKGAVLKTDQQNFPIISLPKAVSAPPVWVLGASRDSALMAGSLGLPYSFPYHVTDEGVSDALSSYRQHFQANTRLEKPNATISIMVVLGKTEEEATLLAKAHLYVLSAFRTGELVEQQRLAEDLKEFNFPNHYGEMIKKFKQTWFIGTPQKVATQIKELANKLEVEELLINPIAAAFQSDDIRKAPNREFTLNALAEELKIPK